MRISDWSSDVCSSDLIKTWARSGAEQAVMRETLFSGDHLLTLWLWAFLLVGLAVGIAKGFFKARKIQPKGFKWITLRNESVFAVINLLITGFILGNGTTYLKEHGWILFDSEPASWWIVALEYALYFFLFDTYFYWLHRWIDRKSTRLNSSHYCAYRMQSSA